ncbi:hypothetical protein B0H13DRAFT_1895257 [Mycena leptocephala]|nr:hypothetical protein B0H13DRAFT_1895257 [Mycena leptocephala]
MSENPRDSESPINKGVTLCTCLSVSSPLYTPATLAPPASLPVRFLTQHFFKAPVWTARRLDATRCEIDFDDFKPTKLFIGNIHYGLDDEALIAEFMARNYSIAEARIYRLQKRSCGCGYVIIASNDQAERLLTQGPEIKNRRIRVYRFTPKSTEARKTPSTEQKKLEQKFFSMVLTLAECRIIQLFRLINGENLPI